VLGMPAEKTAESGAGVSCHYFPKVLSVSVKNPSELAILCPLVFLGWVYVPVIAEYRCSADGGRFWTQETQ
jgi:hypothetical protein